MRLENVVVTGLGTALPGIDSVAQILCASPVQAKSVDPARVLGRRGLRYKDRATQTAMAAASPALADAGFFSDGLLTVAADSIGVVVSSNLGNLDTACSVAGTIERDSTSVLSPMDLPNASSNVVATSIAIRFDLRGPNLMVCNGNPSGLDALFCAGVMVEAGRADRVLVVGVETSNPVVDRLVGQPTTIDGAVAIVVEDRSEALRRGAKARARLAAYIKVSDLSRLPGSLGEDDPTAWFIPEGFDGAAVELFPNAPRIDLSERLGHLSGALGVLQCAAGVCLLDRPRASVVLTAGTPPGATASLLLRDTCEATSTGCDAPTLMATGRQS